MKPKPDPVLHRPELIRVLQASLGRIDPEAAAWLGAREENFVLVSWTPLLYDRYRDLALDLPGVERLLAEPVASAADRRDIDAWTRRVKRYFHLFGVSFPRLWPWLATPDLEATLGDVVAYLQNADGRSDRIRQLVSDEVERAWSLGERVLLIGHSLGSVIAYECLWQLGRELGRDERVDLLMTLGSPLATRFIRKAVKGADRDGAERYPGNIRRWSNISARGELVALHRAIKPFFAPMLGLGLIEAIEDVPDIYNHFRADGGIDVHKSYGYLNHAAVASRICRWLKDV